MMKRISFFLIVLSSFIATAQTADIKFEHFGTDEGLSQSQVNCILQDSEGFIWICTYDGLNRYDGYNYKVYYHDPFDRNSIASNDINYIIEDKKGKLWICTQNNGVDIFDKSTNNFRHLRNERGYPDDLGCENVETILEDSKGIIWIGTHKCGLIRYDAAKAKFEHFVCDPDDPYSISDNTIYTMLEDKNGILWIGTKDGLNIFDEQARKFFNYKKNKGTFLNLRENLISKLYLDKKNNLWVAANHYLAKFDRSQNKFQNIDITFKENKEASGYRIWSMLQDISGILWIGTTKGLLKFDEKQSIFSFYCNDPSNPFSLSNNSVWTFIQDYSGNIWLGTDIGANKFTVTRKFNPVGGRKIGSPTERLTYVWAIYQDYKDNVWIGTENGLYRWNRETNDCIEYKHSPGNSNSPSSNITYAIIGDKKGNIWLSAQDGLDRYDYTNNIFFHCSDIPGWNKCINNNTIYKFIIDQSGLFWLAVSHVGLVQFDPEKQTLLSFNNNSPDKDINNLTTAFRIFEDSEYNIWIGTENGLMKFIRKDNKFISYKHDADDPNTISGNDIMSIFEDHEGNMWIGTNGKGLNFFDKEKNVFKCYLTTDGLSSNTIYGILEDASGNLWMSSNNGLSKFNPENMSITNFEASDGLQSKEFNAGSHFKNKHGEMFFGGINGLNIFHPDSIEYNNYIPNIVITEIKILNKRINEAPVLHSGRLELSYSQNFFSFQFAALDFTGPNKNRYKYRMAGFDKNWIDAGNKPWADYTNLDPGEYTFKVIGSNNDGVWNNTGTSLLIIVHPPYWMTWWFRSLIIAFFIVIIWYAFHRRVSYLKKETASQQRFSRQLIDSQENERKRMASELHDGIGQNLLIINNRAKMAVKKNDFDAAKQQIESISEIALESINDVRKIAYNLHPYHLDELGLTKTINSIISKSFEITNIMISQSVDVIDNIFKPEEEIHIFRIIQEGISNIIKHSDAKNAVISVGKEAENIVINITDNGKGMSKEFIDSSLKGSTGFGLKGMYERARLLNSSLQINSSDGQGTTILITIPIVMKNEKSD